jgi:hypothetical protein
MTVKPAKKSSKQKNQEQAQKNQPLKSKSRSEKQDEMEESHSKNDAKLPKVSKKELKQQNLLLLGNSCDNLYTFSYNELKM